MKYKQKITNKKINYIRWKSRENMKLNSIYQTMEATYSNDGTCGRVMCV